MVGVDGSGTYDGYTFVFIFFIIYFYFCLIQFYVPFKIISTHMRRANVGHCGRYFFCTPHYGNIPMKYTEFFFGVKMKIFTGIFFYICLISAQNSSKEYP